MSHTQSGFARRIVLIAAGGLLMAAAAGRAQTTSTLAFVEVNVVPMDAEGVLMRQTVLIQGDRIIAIDPADDASVPPTAARVEAAGKYLMPGLMDAHVDLLSGSRLAPGLAEAELAVFLANGVTRLRLAAGNPFLLELRERLAAAESPAPSLYVSSPVLSSDPEAIGSSSRIVQTPFEAAAAVREFRNAGYDFVSLAHATAADVYQGIVLTTRGSRLPLVGRVPAPVTLQQALDAGQRITHLDGFIEALTQDEPRPAEGLSGDGVLDPARWAVLEEVDRDRIEDVVRAFVDAEAWTIPLLGSLQRALDMRQETRRPVEIAAEHFMPAGIGNDAGVDSIVAGVPERQRQSYVELRDRIVAQLHAADARLLAGSGDSEGLLPFGFGLHGELAGLVAAGLPPYAALRAATEAPAAFLSRGGGLRAEYAIADEAGIRFASGTASEVDFGRVEIGMTADLVLVAGNPLDDIANARRIEGVVVAGRWLSRGELDGMMADAARRLTAATIAAVGTDRTR